MLISDVCVQRVPEEKVLAVRNEDTQRLRRQEQRRQPPDQADDDPDEHLRTLGRAIVEWELYHSWKHCRSCASVVAEPLNSASFSSAVVETTLC